MSRPGGAPPGGAEGVLRAALGEPEARASVTFLGTGRIEVLRFLDAGRGLLRYATLGMSAGQPPGRGCELVLTLRAGRLAPGATDAVLRPLAVLAASPEVEGAVAAPGASFDLGQPLWPGAPFTAVLVGEHGEAELPAPPEAAVRLLPVLPLTPHEAAWKRARGAAALRGRWRRHSTDPLDPARVGDTP